MSSLGFFCFILGLLMKFSFSSIFAQNEQLSAELVQNGDKLIIAGLTDGITFLFLFAAGIVFLAFSTRSKIRDANRGVEYERLH